jgi:hypothetical protein
LVAAHLVLPVTGLVLGAVLMLTLLAALLDAQDARMGPMVVLFCLAVLGADALAVLWMSGWRPRVPRLPGGTRGGAAAAATGGGEAADAGGAGGGTEPTGQ